MAEIPLRLTKAEAKALAKDHPRHVAQKSLARRSAEFKLREAIWAAYPELRELPSPTTKGGER